jgi:hypothetical protein
MLNAALGVSGDTTIVLPVCNIMGSAWGLLRAVLRCCNNGYCWCALQVTVAVVDSGIDANHPDLVYAGGKSWVRRPSIAMPGDMTDPGVDFYGHGEG